MSKTAGLACLIYDYKYILYQTMKFFEVEMYHKIVDDSVNSVFFGGKIVIDNSINYKEKNKSFMILHECK